MSIGRVPGVELIRRYKVKWLRRDLVAGAALTALLIPQGMAYAQISGLPPVTGLYTTVLACVGYAIFGPSPTLVVGPDSALAPMIAAAILLSGGPAVDTSHRIELAGALSILVGLICVFTALARLHFITELLSKPVRVGYLNGLAIVIFVGQLPKLFGFKASGSGLLGQLRGFVHGLRHGDVVAAAAVIGICSLVTILACRRWVPAVPGPIVAVVVATAITAALDLAAKHGVPVAGAVPRGLPALAMPTPGFHAIGELLKPALGIAFVALADTSTFSRSLATKDGRKPDAKGELIALGAANIAAGLFRGFPVSASPGRTAVARSSGARTQVTGVVAALTIVIILVLANGLTTNLPLAALAAIVIASSIRLFDLPTLVWMFRVRKSELVFALAAMIGVIAGGVLQGIVIAILLSLGAFIGRAWRPHHTVLVRVTGEKGYRDIERQPQGLQIPGLVLYRFDAPLFFANADCFERDLMDAIDEVADTVLWVIVAAEPITDIDVTAAEMLSGLIDELESRSITLAFAELKAPVKDRLRQYGLYDRIGDDRYFVTIGRAIDGYVAATGTPWVDWTDTT